MEIPRKKSIKPSTNRCNQLLLEIVEKPGETANLTLREWDHLLPLARQAGILGYFYPRLKQHGLLKNVPAQVTPHLEAANVLAEDRERMIRWEVNRVQRALIDVGTPLVLLKGAAYVMAGLPCARGRLASDVDIMAPKSHINLIEKALQTHGWDVMKLDAYDQRYYRNWMHELPPLRHRIRGTIVDIHHTILPQTSRLTPNAELLLANAQSLPDSRLKVLAPADMVLHCAAHAFHDGELRYSLRDLVDLHELLCGFSDTPEFWEELPRRAFQLDLQRPLFYALRYCQRFLHTPIPGPVNNALNHARPIRPALWLMDKLLKQTVVARKPHRLNVTSAHWLLYIRSHWLRMPPLLLTKHLLYKTGKQLRQRLDRANQING